MPQQTATNSQTREKTGFLQPLSSSGQKGSLYDFRWKILPSAVVINPYLANVEYMVSS
jgi:hypothetical protein